MYFESFCESLEVEEEPSSSSFLDMLTMTNLDSGEITAMDHPVWDMDANQWLDELMVDLEEPPSSDTVDSLMCEGDVTDWLDDLMGDLEDPSSLENTVDVHDLLHDNVVVDDVMDDFDFDVDLLS